jgi:hypothetical protein
METIAKIGDDGRFQLNENDLISTEFMQDAAMGIVLLRNP